MRIRCVTGLGRTVGQPHGDLDVVLAVPGHFLHAKSLVESLDAVVEGEHVKDQVLALPPGLISECVNEEGADALAVIIGMDLDAGDVDLAEAVLITIESTFATVRHRTKVTKGPGSRAAGLAMAFKLIESAQDRWRCVNAPHLVALVRAGATFTNGKLVERPSEET